MGSFLLKQAGLDRDQVTHYAFEFAHEYDREYGSAGFGRSFLPEDEFLRILTDKAMNSIPNCGKDDAASVAMATAKILQTMGITLNKAAASGLARIKNRPLLVIRDVRDKQGERIGPAYAPYDGTPEDAIEVAKAISDKLDEEFGPGWSNVNSRIVATGEDGRPKWSISPNFKHVAEVGTDEARYIWGDTSARTPDEPKRLKAAVKRRRRQRRIEITQNGWLSADGKFTPVPEDVTHLEGGEAEVRVIAYGEFAAFDIQVDTPEVRQVVREAIRDNPQIQEIEIEIEGEEFERKLTPEQAIDLLERQVFGHFSSKTGVAQEFVELNKEVSALDPQRDTEEPGSDMLDPRAKDAPADRTGYHHPWGLGFGTEPESVRYGSVSKEGLNAEELKDIRIGKPHEVEFSRAMAKFIPVNDSHLNAPREPFMGKYQLAKGTSDWEDGSYVVFKGEKPIAKLEPGYFGVDPHYRNRGIGTELARVYIRDFPDYKPQGLSPQAYRAMEKAMAQKPVMASLNKATDTLKALGIRSTADLDRYINEHPLPGGILDSRYRTLVRLVGEDATAVIMHNLATDALALPERGRKRAARGDYDDIMLENRYKGFLGPGGNLIGMGKDHEKTMVDIGRIHENLAVTEEEEEVEDQLYMEALDDFMREGNMRIAGYGMPDSPLYVNMARPPTEAQRRFLGRAIRNQGGVIYDIVTGGGHVHDRHAQGVTGEAVLPSQFWAVVDKAYGGKTASVAVPEHKRVVEAGGGEYIADQDGLVYFNSPATHSTLVLKETELTPEAVRRHIEEKDATFKTGSGDEKPESEKHTHEEVKYESPSRHGGQTCAGCRWFIAPDACTGVQKPIRPGDWCTEFDWGGKTAGEKPLSGYGAGSRNGTEQAPHAYRGYADGLACYVCGEKRDHPIHQQKQGSDKLTQNKKAGLVQCTGIAFPHPKLAGQWGDRSYDSDSVHDILDEWREQSDLGFDQPVPEGNVGPLLAEIHETEFANPEAAQDYVGVVAFLLEHGSDVPEPYRSRAAGLADQLIHNEGYLAGWNEPEKRLARLEQEYTLLKGGRSTRTAGGVTKLPDGSGFFTATVPGPDDKKDAAGEPPQLGPARPEIVPKGKKPWKFYVLPPGVHSLSGPGRRYYVDSKEKGADLADEMFGISARQRMDLITLGNTVLEDGTILKCTQAEHKDFKIADLEFHRDPEFKAPRDDQKRYLDKDEVEPKATDEPKLEGPTPPTGRVPLREDLARRTVLGAKQMPDEYWLDLVERQEAKAKELFLASKDVAQIAQDNGWTMEQAWEHMGRDFANELYDPRNRVLAAKRASTAANRPHAEAWNELEGVRANLDYLVTGEHFRNLPEGLQEKLRGIYAELEAASLEWDSAPPEKPAYKEPLREGQQLPPE